MAVREAWRWVVAEQGITRFEAAPLAAPGPTEVVLQTEASLVSAGTELAIYTGIHQGLTNPNTTWPKYPQPMGYMGVARVIGAGADARWPVGQRLLTSTGHASHSLLETTGAERAWPLPEDVPAEHAVFARMAKTAITAVAQAGVTVGQSVAVVGLGIIGQITLRLFDACGSWPVVGVDPVEFRRDAARRGGAVAAIDPEREDPPQRLREVLPQGADIVIDSTGWASALPGAMRLAKDAGTVVVLGSPRGTAPDVDFYSDLHRRSIRVVGAHDSGIGPQLREGLPWTNERMVPLVIEMVRRGKLPVADLISHLVEPKALPDMYEGLLHDKERFLGVVLRWLTTTNT